MFFFISDKGFGYLTGSGYSSILLPCHQNRCIPTPFLRSLQVVRAALQSGLTWFKEMKKAGIEYFLNTFLCIAACEFIVDFDLITIQYYKAMVFFVLPFSDQP